MYIPDGESWTRWLHEIRQIELVGAMKCVSLGQDSTVLELGCGDGFQLGLLRERFGRVFAIDPEAFLDPGGGFVKSMAEALPFPDRLFDLVISSNVSEHLNDRRCAMEEVRRVLRPGGYAVHIVPTRIWKLASLALNPVGYPLRVVEKWYARRRLRRDVIAAGRALPNGLPSPGVLQVLGRCFYPPIHGTFPSHLAEYRSYTRQQWVQTFAIPGFTFIAEVPLFFYTQFGLCRFCFVPARQWAARHGMASSRAFILQKATGCTNSRTSR